MSESDPPSLYVRVQDLVYDVRHSRQASWMTENESGTQLTIGWKGEPPADLVDELRTRCGPGEAIGFEKRRHSLVDLIVIADRIRSQLRKAGVAGAEADSLGPGDDILVSLIPVDDRTDTRARTLALHLGSQAGVAVTVTWDDEPRRPVFC